MRRISVALATLFAAALMAPDDSFARAGGGGRGGGGMHGGGLGGFKAFGGGHRAAFGGGHRLGGGRMAIGGGHRFGGGHFSRAHMGGGHIGHRMPARHIALATQLPGARAHSLHRGGQLHPGHRPAAPHHAPVGHGHRLIHEGRKQFVFFDHDKRFGAKKFADRRFAFKGKDSRRVVFISLGATSLFFGGGYVSFFDYGGFGHGYGGGYGNGYAYTYSGDEENANGNGTDCNSGKAYRSGKVYRSATGAYVGRRYHCR